MWKKIGVAALVAFAIYFLIRSPVESATVIRGVVRMDCRIRRAAWQLPSQRSCRRFFSHGRNARLSLHRRGSGSCRAASPSRAMEADFVAPRCHCFVLGVYEPVFFLLARRCAIEV